MVYLEWLGLDGSNGTTDADADGNVSADDVATADDANATHDVSAPDDVTTHHRAFFKRIFSCFCWWCKPDTDPTANHVATTDHVATADNITATDRSDAATDDVTNPGGAGFQLGGDEHHGKRADPVVVPANDRDTTIHVRCQISREWSDGLDSNRRLN
jgi:hypothetical protein